MLHVTDVLLEPVTVAVSCTVALIKMVGESGKTDTSTVGVCVVLDVLAAFVPHPASPNWSTISTDVTTFFRLSKVDDILSIGFEFSRSVHCSAGQLRIGAEDVFGEAVADVGVGEQVAGVGGVGLNLLAQLTDEGAQVVDLLAVVRAPD